MFQTDKMSGENTAGLKVNDGNCRNCDINVRRLEDLFIVKLLENCCKQGQKLPPVALFRNIVMDHNFVCSSFIR